MVARLARNKVVYCRSLWPVWSPREVSIRTGQDGSARSAEPPRTSGVWTSEAEGDASKKQAEVHITKVEESGDGGFVSVCFCDWTSTRQDTRQQALGVAFIHRMANR